MHEGTVGDLKVAVKVMKTEMTTDPIARILFAEEVLAMTKLYHPKIVKMYGICTEQEPWLVIMELVTPGNLLDHLQARSMSTIADLLRIATQIAEGMAYLERSQYIHNDLALKNILLSGCCQLILIAYHVVDCR